MGRRPVRGRPLVRAALGATVVEGAHPHVTTSSARVSIPAAPDTGGWALVHAAAPETRRSLRRRWFPWTLRAWLTTARDGVLALFSWHAPKGPSSR